MITIPIGMAVLLLIVTAILAFVVGWNWSVSHWRHRNRELADQYQEMAERWRVLAEAMDKDPVRMGLNTGQEFMIREMEALLRKHRERLESMT